MPSTAERHHRRERKAARRRRRIATNRRPRRTDMDARRAAGEENFDRLLAAVLKRSRPRQKALDKIAAANRGRRREQEGAGVIPSRHRGGEASLIEALLGSGVDA